MKCTQLIHVLGNCLLFYKFPQNVRSFSHYISSPPLILTILRVLLLRLLRVGKSAVLVVGVHDKGEREGVRPACDGVGCRGTHQQGVLGPQADLLLAHLHLALSLLQKK